MAQIRRRVIAAVVAAAFMASLLVAVPPLRGVAARIGHMRAGWVVAAVALELASCVSFVVIFRLFFDRVPARTARQLAWIEQGSGALLPAGGVGGLAIGGWLLHRGGMTTRAIVERSSALFFLTSAVNVSVLVGAGLLLAAGASHGPHSLLRSVAPITAGVVAAAAVLTLPILLRRSQGRRWPGWLLDAAAGVDAARRTLIRPSWRVVGALGFLGFDIAVLGATFAASGHALPVAALLLGYLIGYLANLIPLPGGFGVTEGGLAGALIGYGAPATQAAAAVVVYRAIAFWIPSLGGLLGYAALRRQIPTATRRSRGVGHAYGAGRSAVSSGNTEVSARAAPPAANEGAPLSRGSSLAGL